MTHPDHTRRRRSPRRSARTAAPRAHAGLVSDAVIAGYIQDISTRPHRLREPRVERRVAARSA